MMKKYLMTGMAAIVACAAMTSCSNHEATDGGQIVEMKYESVFKQTFGEPAANQDWGFASRVLSGTRGAQPESNLWGDANNGFGDYPKPADITPEERKAVLAVFNQKGEEHYTALVDYHNFFVQQVSSTEIGREHMNELACLVAQQTKYWPRTYDYNNLTLTDVNNFNAGAYSDGEDKYEQGCMLMLGSSTTDWAYKTSQGGGEVLHFFRMEKIGDYYYVGFDYASFRQASENANEQYDRDLVYNDWIVKIVPGLGESSNLPKQYECRIICEDLTASTGTDFDFNDVVFNLKYTEGVNKTFVTIYAAGGTLPLYVAGKEVHQLFKEANPDKTITTKTMINTGYAGGANDLAPVSFELEGQISPADVEVRVEKEGALIPLKSEVGEPAAKIAVNPDFEWCAEFQPIQQKYPNFSNFVKDGNINWY